MRAAVLPLSDVGSQSGWGGWSPDLNLGRPGLWSPAYMAPTVALRSPVCPWGPEPHPEMQPGGQSFWDQPGARRPPPAARWSPLRKILLAFPGRAALDAQPWTPCCEPAPGERPPELGWVHGGCIEGAVTGPGGWLDSWRAGPQSPARRTGRGPSQKQPPRRKPQGTDGP